MKLTLISESKELMSLFRKNLKWCECLSFASAWASPIEGLSEKLLDAKIKQGVVGIHFYQTDPRFIERFIGDDRMKFIMQTSGTFHPKMYLFEKGKEWRMIVGSANFTNAAFSKNSEVGVLMTDADDGDGTVLLKAKKILATYKKGAESFDRKKFESYKATWTHQQKKLRSLSGRYGSSNLKVSRKEPKPVFLSGCLNLRWKDFYKLVIEEEGKGHNYALRKPVLSAVKDIFSKNESFSDCSLIERQLIAGTPCDYEYEGKMLDFGLFGSMQGNGKFKHYVNEQDDVIANALDCIPKEGLVEYNQYKEYVNRIMVAENLSIGTVTRLLAMKRPDTFVCLDSKNAKQLCKDFKITNFTNSRLSKEEKFELYWTEIISRIRDSIWWNTSAPLNEEERFVWNNRVAFLDSLFYEY